MFDYLFLELAAIVNGKIDQVWKASSEDIRPLREYCERIISENN